MIMEFGHVCCGGCEKTLGYFPDDTVPQNVELYCEECKENLEEDKVA